MTDKTDIYILDQGVDTATLQVRTEDAQEWVEDNLAKPWKLIGNKIICEGPQNPDALTELLTAMWRDGLTTKVTE